MSIYCGEQIKNSWRHRAEELPTIESSVYMEVQISITVLTWTFISL